MVDFSCKNGIKLQIRESDKFTRNMLSVSFICPLDAATASENGLLAAVMGRGCRKYPEINFVSDFLDTHYGATFTVGTGKKGENLILRFSVSYIDARYIKDGTDIEKDMLSFLKMMITDSLIDNPEAVKERTETEKKNIIDSINAVKNDKTTYANLRCATLMFSGERYCVDSSGTVEELMKLSHKDLPGIYRRLVSDSKIIVFGLGRFNEEALKNWVGTLFDEQFPGLKVSGTITDAGIRKSVGQVRRVTETDAMTQSKLVLGFRTGAKSYMDNVGGYVLFNAIFSTAPCSRLFLNVREKLSLCYYCSSIFDRHKAAMLVYAGISSGKKEQAEAAILKQIRDIAKEVPEEELEKTKQIIIDGILQAEDSPTAMESQYLNSVIGKCGMTSGEYISVIKNVSADDVKAAANAMMLDTVYFLKGTDEVGDPVAEDFETEEDSYGL